MGDDFATLIEAAATEKMYVATNEPLRVLSEGVSPDFSGAACGRMIEVSRG